MDLNFENIILEIAKHSYLKQIPFHYYEDGIEHLTDVKYYGEPKKYMIENGYVLYYTISKYEEKNYHKISLFFSQGGYNTFLMDLKKAIEQNNWDETLIFNADNERQIDYYDSLLKIFSKEQGDEWLVDFAQQIHVEKDEEKNTEEDE